MINEHQLIVFTFSCSEYSGGGGYLLGRHASANFRSGCQLFVLSWPSKSQQKIAAAVRWLPDRIRDQTASVPQTYGRT